MNETRNSPRLLVTTAGMPTVEPSQVNASCIRLANAWPDTVTLVPAAPLVGERLRLGPLVDVYALVATSGRA